MNEAQKLFAAAEAEGVTMIVYYPGEAFDYKGTDAKLAWEHASACDEIHVTFYREGAIIGWALVIPGLADDEVVSDYSGDWIDQQLKKDG